MTIFAIMIEERLCKLVEQKAGRKMLTPRDFDWLSDQIQLHTGEYVSSTTLKRMWGYIDEPVNPRRFTLDLLAQFAGLSDYDAVKKQTPESQSNLTMAKFLSCKELAEGQKIRLRWHPDRVCVIELLHDCRFVIRESANSKLNAGDEFDCMQIIEGEKLYFSKVCHLGKMYPLYEIGNIDGVRFELIE